MVYSPFDLRIRAWLWTLSPKLKIKEPPPVATQRFSWPLSVNPEWVITAICSGDGAARVEFTSPNLDPGSTYRIDYVCTQDHESVSCVWKFNNGGSLLLCPFCSVQFSSFITRECCISNVVEVFMQVLGPINRGIRWQHHHWAVNGIAITSFSGWTNFFSQGPPQWTEVCSWRMELADVFLLRFRFTALEKNHVTVSSIPKAAVYQYIKTSVFLYMSNRSGWVVVGHVQPL